MKLLHISDLHLGKRVNEFSMLEDQKYILARVLEICEAEKPGCLLIAGDIYDKPQPPAEAMSLFDSFLTSLSEAGIPAVVIAGNHDSAERLDFGAEFFARGGIRICGKPRFPLPVLRLGDEYGPVDIYALPFFRPSDIRQFFPEVKGWQDAAEAVIAATQLDSGARNVIVAHQFFTASGAQPERSESESFSVGGLDNIDISVFDAFDYVALGHIHGPQQLGRPACRYAGSPLKYSFSEARHKKSISLIELGKKGDVNIRSLPLVPLRDMREIRGPIEELISAACGDDYIRAVLTDRDEPADAMARLRSVYPHIMRLDILHSGSELTDLPELPENKSPLELFRDFYEMQNGAPLEGERLLAVKRILEEEVEK